MVAGMAARCCASQRQRVNGGGALRSPDATACREAGPAPSDGPPSNSAAFAATLRSTAFPREIEVAELLMKGHTVSAIAGKLFISENTTRGHAKSIYKKLGIHSRQGSWST